MCVVKKQQKTINKHDCNECVFIYQLVTSYYLEKPSRILFNLCGRHSKRRCEGENQMRELEREGYASSLKAADFSGPLPQRWLAVALMHFWNY